MDILLNDGTFARNVSVFEYEQLKEKGLVGNNLTHQTSNVPTITGKTRLVDEGITKDDLTLGDVYEMNKEPQFPEWKCWKCGTLLNANNMSSVVYLSNPPKYTCETCEGVK